MQRPGEVGLGGESLLGLEVVEALLEEGAGCDILVSRDEEADGKGGKGRLDLLGFFVFFCP